VRNGKAWSGGVGAACFGRFPDGDMLKRWIPGPSGDLGHKEFVADLGDVLDGRVQAIGRCELSRIEVEVLVVEPLDDGLIHDRIKLGGRKVVVCKCDSAADFKLVVVAVARGVVALAEDVAVLALVERGDIEAMSGGELVALAEQRLGWGSHAILQAVCGREFPSE